MRKRNLVLSNGILKVDGKPTFGLGVSYYASYHERKVPVPPEHDRYGEAKKDIRKMAEMGLNLVRFAGLGTISYDETGNVKVETPLADFLLRTATEHGIGAMIRLQGYTMNLSGWQDGLMVDSDGHPMDTTKWYDFIRNSFFHKGILKDNGAATEALAKHYASIGGVSAFQTYNEPHYPSNGIFDYHPATIEAYRKWLVENGFKSAGEVENYEPPHARPNEKDGDGSAWILWRRFAAEALTGFLGDCSDIAKTATGIESMTCQTTDATNQQNAARGVDFFGVAARMDAVGITHYYLITKPEAYLANYNLDLAESAARIYGKKMWIIESDAKTNIPPEIFRRQTYMAVGSGCKGILFYQWRGDYVYPDSPEGNEFGFLNYDGTPSTNFENAHCVISLLNRLSDRLVRSDRRRSGVAILHSDYAYLNADSLDNSGTASRYSVMRNRWLDETRALYTALRKAGISPDFVRGCDLSEYGKVIKVLYLPSVKLLSAAEREQIDRYREAGGTVMERNEWHRHKTGYFPHGFKPDIFHSDYDIPDTLALSGITPEVVVDEKECFLAQVLENEEEYIVCLTCIANLPMPKVTVHIRLTLPVENGLLYTFSAQSGRKISARNGHITLSGITDGGFLILPKKKGDAE